MNSYKTYLVLISFHLYIKPFSQMRDIFFALFLGDSDKKENEKLARLGKKYMIDLADYKILQFYRESKFSSFILS